MKKNIIILILVVTNLLSLVFSFAQKTIANHAMEEANEQSQIAEETMEIAKESEMLANEVLYGDFI